MSALRPPASTFFGFPPIAGFFKREAPPPRRMVEPTVGARTRPAPVSYTHLTLPTNREV